MWILYTASSFAAATVCILFAVILFFNNKKSIVNLRFAIVSFFIGMWALCPFLTSVIADKQNALFYGRFMYIFAILTGPAFFHFVFTTLDIHKKRINKYLIVISYSIAMVFLYFSFSDFFIKGFIAPVPNAYVDPGPLYAVWIVYFLSLCPYAIYLLFKHYKESKGYKKEQLKFLSLGFLLALIGGGLHIFSPYINIEIVPHDLFILAWCVTVAYAVSKYRYLNVKTVLAKAILFIIIYIVILGVPFYIGFSSDKWFFASVLLFIFATVGPIVLRILNRRAENLLLTEQIQYQQFLVQASKGMVEQYELSNLTQLIVRMIKKSVKVNFVHLFVYDENKDIFYCVASRGIPKKNDGIEFSIDSKIIKYMKLQKEPFMFLSLTKDLKNIFNTISDDINLIVPSMLRDDLIAFLILGDKENETIYSMGDVEVFRTLSNQAALAIENCNFLAKSKKQQERLFEAEKLASIGGMADGMAHQIKNRLNQFAMIGGELGMEIEDFENNYKSFVQSEVKVQNMTQYIKTIANSISTNVKKTNDILQGILSFAKTTEKDTYFSCFSLKDVIEQSLGLIRVKHQKEKIPLVTDIPDNDSIYGVRSQIQEAVFNCIDNAVEAIKEKEEYYLLNQPADERKNFIPLIQISLIPMKQSVQINISDNGIGIKEENRSKIFSAFFTTKPSSKSGSGIGAYVVKRMIEENHNGKITFKSQYGVGTTFTIVLPTSKNA